MKGREAVLEALRRTKPAVDLQPTGSVATPLSAPEVVPAMAAAGSVAATSSSVAGPVPATIEIGGITLAFDDPRVRSEEHTSELQSLMRISYAVFCLKKKNKKNHITNEYRMKNRH